jgi:hypothetical protein
LLPPAARGALFEKTPLRGGAFTVQGRRKTLKTTYRLHEHSPIPHCKGTLDPLQKLFIKEKQQKGNNGAKFKEAKYNDCSHMKSFWESRTLFSKRVLAVGDKKKF